ncbi:MAG: 2,3,4,5-tetrahydropyridine-2,6-dicarboxylate N-succinyltransferase [Acidobacteriota bacterium]|nr:2,3,4,5-tetrahydropyridine-2,6-dicarboxylate N-succinyltransferase [Acidobacteriota bacterium]
MTYEEVLDQLEAGTVRAAEPGEDGSWRVNTHVKEAILDAFRNGAMVNHGDFVDKETVLPRRFTVADGVRLVPGGTSVRRGSYVAPGVVVMPPAYINVGAYVDEGTMVDSHALVGSCAQVGRNVHLSAAVQLGGVLEPIGATPVIIEDDAFIGAGAVIVEGIRVGRRAVIAPGVTLSKATPVYDAVNERVLERGEPVPDDAVVIPGTRPMRGDWAAGNGLAMNCPIIVKYRDAGSDAALMLEESLR